MAQTSLHRVEWVTPDQWPDRLTPAYTTAPWPEGVTAVSAARYGVTDKLRRALDLPTTGYWELVVVEHPRHQAPWWGAAIQSRRVSGVSGGPGRAGTRQNVILDYDEIIEINGRLYELGVARDPVPAHSALAVRPLGEVSERAWRQAHPEVAHR